MIPGKAGATVLYAALRDFPRRWLMGVGQDAALEGVRTRPSAEKTPSQVSQVPPTKSGGSTGRTGGSA